MDVEIIERQKKKELNNQSIQFLKFINIYKSKTDLFGNRLRTDSVRLFADHGKHNAASLNLSNLVNLQSLYFAFRVFLYTNLECQFSSRRQAYEKILDINGCITISYKTTSSFVVRNTSCETLATYFIDGVVIQAYLEVVNECTRVSKLILTDKRVKSVLSTNEYTKTEELECMFSNVEIILCVRILILSTAVSNCSGERAFPVLKRVNHEGIFSIEAELVGKLDFNDTINTFAHKKNKNKSNNMYRVG
ncbi:hypothetical protein AGLY_011839 [Aphis glycines]|uniref:Uncharacterized protein n=1 Tax=Aphis glycines TaxID=307491 RepID=A0A6G0TBB8_APHGL|nr:hypothetical protein AGLY_011839 [Aphis glycines]